MKKSYVNGYAEKIGYWQYKLNKAIMAGDLDGIQFASDKIYYFVKRQVQVYGWSNVGNITLNSSKKMY
jgi:hypothetical protein